MRYFLGENLLQELNSPWELTLTELVPEVVEFRPADWVEEYISAQSAFSLLKGRDHFLIVIQLNEMVD